ncbi:MAG: transposase [Verrucomicrobiales bacterium]|nr:transposase [Verrucomicrobiales bacterium]
MSLLLVFQRRRDDTLVALFSMSDQPKFFNPFEDIEKHGKKLPHWEQSGATYFVTFRLGDSIPQSQLAVWKDERSHWISKHPQPWGTLEETEYHQRFSGEIDRLLDHGAGCCLLRDSAASELLADVLEHYHERRYFLHTFVVMPNHVHALVSLSGTASLADTVKQWKGVSARQMNQALLRNGELWQKNYFDRLIRDCEHFFRVARYIRANPEKAKLNSGDFLLREFATVTDILDAR